MIRIIDRKRYNTETATLIAYDGPDYSGNFDSWTEALYRTPKGAYFLYSSGGPRSVYGNEDENGNISGSECINVLSQEDVADWLERAQESALLDEMFPGKIEDA